MIGKEKVRAYYIIVGTILAFLMFNFDWNMGLAYLAFILLDYVAYDSDRFISLPLEKRQDNRFSAFGWGLAGYIGFISISLLLITPLKSLGITGTMSLFANTIPAFAGNNFLKVVAWGILIPIIETNFFFGRVLEFTSEKFFKINPNSKQWLRLIPAIMIVVLAFVLFHASVKGIQNNIALIMTGVFALVSCVVVVHFGETKQAIWMHIFANTLAILLTLAIILPK